MKVAVVILNWNGRAYLQDCLNSVLKLEKGKNELSAIVVDNASTDGSNLVVKEKYPQFKLIENSTNLGFTGGNNVGITEALQQDADYVFLLNPDTLVDKKLLVSLVEKGESEPQIGLLGPKIYFAAGHEFHQDRYRAGERGRVFWYAGGLINWADVASSHRGVDEVDQGQYDQPSETDFISGCGMLVKKEVFQKIGLLDDKYYLYWEDVDFSQRAKNAGWQLVYCPTAKMWHVNAGASGVGGPLHDYYLTRNRMLFASKYASLRTKLAIIREGLKLIFKGRPWQRRAVLDFCLGNFNKGSY